MNKDLILKILSELQEDPYFREFKFRKSDTSFIKKTTSDLTTGLNRLTLRYHESYDLERNCIALLIEPLYGVRFDVLHKWFEKYSFRTLADQRYSYSIGFEGGMLNRPSEFLFKWDYVDYERDFIKMKEELILTSRRVFQEFSTLSQLYDYQIQPVLDGHKKLPDVGAAWVFQYLKLCRLIHPDQYEKVKQVILQQVEVMNNRGEPNIIKYYANLDIILADLESQA